MLQFIDLEYRYPITEIIVSKKKKRNHSFISYRLCLYLCHSEWLDLRGESYNTPTCKFCHILQGSFE